MLIQIVHFKSFGKFSDTLTLPNKIPPKYDAFLLIFCLSYFGSFTVNSFHFIWLQTTSTCVACVQIHLYSRWTYPHVFHMYKTTRFPLVTSSG